MDKNILSVWSNDLTQQLATVLSSIDDTLDIISAHHAHLPPARA